MARLQRAAYAVILTGIAKASKAVNRLPLNIRNLPWAKAGNLRHDSLSCGLDQRTVRLHRACSRSRQTPGSLLAGAASRVQPRAIAELDQSRPRAAERRVRESVGKATRRRPR